MKRPLVFAAAVAAQVAVLASMALPQMRTVRSGARVTLPVIPVDPNDLFRGEYVRLGYGISRVDPALWEGPRPAEGEDVWVRLEPRDASWAPTAERATRGPDVPGAVWLRGKRGASPEWVTFGLEEFFVRQGRGPRIEQAMRRGIVLAEFAVAVDGTGTLTALVVNGERIE